VSRYAPPNTYEASPCQVGKQVPLTTAWSVIPPHCAFVSAAHSIFASKIWCSVLDSAPNTDENQGNGADVPCYGATRPSGGILGAAVDGGLASQVGPQFIAKPARRAGGEFVRLPCPQLCWMNVSGPEILVAIVGPEEALK